MRNYGRIKTSIWADDQFRQLEDAPQALYLRLLSAPTLTLAGVCDWRPKRIALYTKGMTTKAVEKAASVLIESRYVFTDDDSEELLIRTFVKHEAVIQNPKTAGGLEAAYKRIVSPYLRSELTDELLRLRTQEPEHKGWDCLSIALRSPIDRLSDRVPIPPLPITKNHLPAASTADRATALPDDWSPNESHAKYATANGIDIHHQAEQFTNHHAAKGSKFVDWDRAFRTWLGNAKDWGRPRQQDEHWSQKPWHAR